MERSSYVPPGYIPAPQGDVDNQEGHNSFNYSHHVASGAWSSGICACFDDMESCCIGFWCPCVLFGKNVEFLEGRSCIGPCILHFLLWGVITGSCCAITDCTPLGLLCSLVPCYAYSYRKVIRAKYNLQDMPCGDFATHVFCHTCALCQEYREIREHSDGVSLSVRIPPPTQTMESFTENR